MSDCRYPGEHSWRNCRNCRLHTSRRNVVLTRSGRVIRGERPFSSYLRLLLLGEGPGKTEDATGYPMVGETGRLLRIIEDWVTQPYEYVITNVVSCRPPENRAPTEQEIELCRPKIVDLVANVPFDAVVYLGAVAKAYETDLPTLSLTHPAAIARMEYRLVPLKEEALKLSRFLENRYAVLDNLQDSSNSS